MPYARSGPVRIHYETLGDPGAPPLVLIRGLARSARYWVDFHELCAERFRVVLVDNRGVGFSDAPPPPYSTAQMADDIVAVLDDAGIERAHVLGISLGGMIAQWVAARHPGRVARLVLGCTTAGGRLGGATPLGASFALLRGGTMPFHEAMRYTAEYVCAERFLAERPDVIDRWIEIAQREPPPFSGLVGQILAAARHDCTRHLPRVAAPTLVVTGDADRLIPPIHSYRLAARLPRASLRILPGAGHDFPTEVPEQAAELVTRFLAG